MVNEEYEMRVKIHKINKLESTVRNNTELNQVKKEREERDKMVLQKNELDLLEDILKHKS